MAVYRDIFKDTLWPWSYVSLKRNISEYTEVNVARGYLFETYEILHLNVLAALTTL